MESKKVQTADKTAEYYVSDQYYTKQTTGRVREKPAPKNRRKHYVTALILVVLLVGIVIGLLTLQSKQSSTPIDIYKNGIEYSLYYPNELPEGFVYKQDSANATNGLVIFTLAKGSSEIVITQQKGPSETIDFRIDGFSPATSNIGTMLVGLTQGAPTAIIRSRDTLITLKGTLDLEQSTLIALADNLEKVE